MRGKKRVQWLDLVQEQNRDLAQSLRLDLACNRSVDYYIQSDDLKFCGYVRNQLATFLQSEINQVNKLLDGTLNIDLFFPAVNFSDETQVDSEPSPSVYLKKLDLIKVKLSLLNINEQSISDFLEMVFDLFSIIDKSKPIFQKKGALEYNKMIERLDEVTYRNSIFDLEKLQSNIEEELIALKKYCVSNAKRARRNGDQGLVEKLDHQHVKITKLETILKAGKANFGETKKVEDLLLIAQYILRNFDGSSRGILVRSLRKDFFKEHDEKGKKEECLKFLNELVQDNGRIAKILREPESIMSSPRIFQPAPPPRHVVAEKAEDSRSPQLNREITLPYLGRK